MDRLRYYRWEIEFQCDAALAAFGRLPRGDPTTLGRIDADEVYRDLQTGMVATANVSKMFWSSTNSDRAAALRVAYALTNESPLKDRRLRNHFEHFDERLDDWIAQHDLGWGIMNRQVQPVTETIREALESGGALHWYDPVSQVAWFYKDRFPLRPLVAELERVRRIDPG